MEHVQLNPSIAKPKKDIRIRAKFANLNKRSDLGEYHAEIFPKKWIRIFGKFTNRAEPIYFDLVFNVGDEAQYGSYNLIYTGKIVSFGQKTITIEDHGESHRLDIYRFIDQNWDFDSERIAKYNAEEMMCI